MNNEVATTNQTLTPSERFTAMVQKEFAANSGGNEIQLTDFQRKLCQNYFIKVDSVLKDSEVKRLQKSEQYRESLSYAWENVNIQKLALDVIAYASVGLDPIQANHVNLIPYKNNTTNKFDFGFIIGYRGAELKAVKYGLDVPSSVVVEVVYKNDKFVPIKKDFHNTVETYEFEIKNAFERGEIVGGFYYKAFKDSPEKNQLRIFTLDDILKRKPKYASVEFWGGEKDEYKNGKKTGDKEKIDGWFYEMVYKTIYRSAYNSITIDSQKIDDHFILMRERENDYLVAAVKHEQQLEANKETLSIEGKEPVVEEQKKEESNPEGDGKQVKAKF